MGEPLYTLVRVDDIGVTEGLDYASGSTMDDYHDEVQLVDPDGNPCAVPIAQQVDSLDPRYDYVDGSVGVAKRALRHKIVLDVDYIGDDVWRKLQRWQMDRAKVYFTPGFGRHTELAWRPVPDTSGSFSDLTGRYTLNVYGDTTRNAFWDDFLGRDVMRGAGYGKQRLVKTPGGAGQIFEKGLENLADPSYPTSSDLGWTIGATGSSSMTISHVAGGFGYNQCPDAMHVNRSAYTGTSYIYRTFSPPSTGTGTVNAAVWIKGQLTPGTRLRIVDSTPTMVAEVILEDSYPDWTRVDIQYVGTVDSSHQLRIYHPDIGSNATANYYVGPTVFTTYVNSSQYSQAYPQWQMHGATRSPDYLQTASNVSWPSAGSYFMALYVPEWFEEVESAMCGLWSPTSSYNTFRAYFVRSAGASGWRLIFYHRHLGSLSEYVTGLLRPGEINTVAATVQTRETKIYLNGAELANNATDVPGPPPDMTLRIAFAAGHGAWPMVPLAFRVENDVWSASRVANEHAVYSSPGALEPVVSARGRAYRIVELPSQPFLCAGGSYLRGRLMLEQAEYDSETADITNSEEG